MNCLIEIIAVLKPTECRLVEKALRSQSQSSRRLDLFKLIAQGHLKTDAEFSAALYGKEPNSAFSHLKTRLYHNILEIIFPDNLPQVEGNGEQVKLDCWRKILVAQFFISREAHLNALITLAECKAMVQQAQLLAEQLIVQDMLLQLQPYSELTERECAESENMEGSVAHLGEYLRAKQAALDLEHLLEEENVLASDLPVALQQLATAMAHTIEHASGKVAYWMLRLLLQYDLARQDLPSAMRWARRLMPMVMRPVPELELTERVLAILDLAKVHYMAGQEPIARQYLQEVLAQVDARSLYTLYAWEQIFLIEVYAGNFVAARKVLASALVHPKLDLAPFHASKWQYYQACMAYIDGNWQLSLTMIAENKELFKYKSKWLLGLKTLEIYNFVAMGKFDLVEYKMNALKQLLKRQKSYDIRRCKYICKVIGTGLRSASDKTASPVLPPARDLMQFWMPFNYEVVGLDLWVQSRMAQGVVHA